MVPFVLCNNHSRLIRVYVCSFCSLFSSLKQTFRSLHISLFSIDCTVIITLGLFFIFIFIFTLSVRLTPYPTTNLRPCVCFITFFFLYYFFGRNQLNLCFYFDSNNNKVIRVCLSLSLLSLFYSADVSVFCVNVNSTCACPYTLSSHPFILAPYFS